MGQLIVVNAPASFTIIWSAVKPWLAPETVAKVDILGKFIALSLPFNQRTHLL